MSWVIAPQLPRPLFKQLPNFNHLDYHYEWYKLLGAGHCPVQDYGFIPHRWPKHPSKHKNYEQIQLVDLEK